MAWTEPGKSKVENAFVRHRKSEVEKVFVRHLFRNKTMHRGRIFSFLTLCQRIWLKHFWFDLPVSLPIFFTTFDCLGRKKKKPFLYDIYQLSSQTIFVIIWVIFFLFQETWMISSLFFFFFFVTLQFLPRKKKYTLVYNFNFSVFWSWTLYF